MIVDVHAHAMPAAYVGLGGPMGGSFAERFRGTVDGTTLEQRFAMMDEAGVARQVLSPTCAPYADEPVQAVRAAQLINDHYATLQRDHPDRLRMWGSLPLPHVDAALVEAARCLDDLGARGIVLGCFCLGGSIAQEAFEPLYAELDRRRAVIFLHPCQNGIHSPQVNDWGLTVCAGASLEDSLAALHLIARGIPLRYPNLRFIVPHFGGILPMLLQRLDGQMPRTGLAEAPSVTARRFFYDTVGWGSRAALLAAVEAFGSGQLVTGSDYPILLPFESYPATFDHVRHSGLPPESVATILGNAGRLLGMA